MTNHPVADNNIFVEPRRRLIAWVRKQLIGPIDSAGEAAAIVGVLPTERFPVGALYPISSAGEGVDPASNDGDEDDVTPEAAEDTGEDPAVVRRYIPPSSLGFSFFIKGENARLQVMCGAVCYERIERDERGQFRNDWLRKQLASGAHENEGFEEFACPKKDSRQCAEKLQGNARVCVEWRRFADGWIVTTSLSNLNEVRLEGQTGSRVALERSEKTLFEASLRCVIDAGEVGAYPRVDRSLLDEEEQEIELQYAHQHVYAVGHGCAAEWRIVKGEVTEIYADTMPTVEVPQMTADTGAHGDSALSLARLSGLNVRHEGIHPDLTVFVDGYANWVSEQEQRITEQLADDHAAAKRIVGRMRVAVARMRSGLELLSQKAEVRLAFALANRSMLEQMRQHDKLKGNSNSEDAYRWRPFQLAFLLTTLESTANPESEFRDTLDLIWFPTGGGKTEAYLGLIAFQIALRRLRFPDTGGGTTVLMRYTLRLLTRDQFIRASRLICALELIRRERDDLGDEPITVGMWVGDATSPNTFQKAAELVEKARTTGGKPALVLDNCPWCGEVFKAERNFHGTEEKFHFLCRNATCEFGTSPSGRLPCNVVDEALYAEPPTMLVATVDKFTRLAWEQRANVFFGGERGSGEKPSLPPELIIQDELHLIAGALGSVAGLYEAALDTVLRLRGLYPKYIASTATIRMASQQVKRLYGRDVAVFPPPGMSCDDSFFARTVPNAQRPGRIYVGYMAPMLNHQMCMAPLAAALLLAPDALFGEGEQDRDALLDAWWTQILYHGSLKGVGTSHTAFVSAVRDYMRLLRPQYEDNNRTTLSIAQLTSLQTAERNAEVFARLLRKCSDEGCLDAVLATNMISVGLDVGRLGLMIINGQPLTTAEYIQASSRVGRGDVPGLVFVNYYRKQARSLSHYEGFRTYHNAFYRFVEPTSVTPYTYQARMRALHAALVIVIRHSGSAMLGNESAGEFNPDDAPTAKAIEMLKRRCRQSVLEDHGLVDAHIDTLVAEWQKEVKRCRCVRRGLDYQVSDRETGRDRLLYNYNDRIRGLWPTLQSLRNVENNVLLKAF